MHIEVGFDDGESFTPTHELTQIVPASPGVSLNHVVDEHVVQPPVAGSHVKQLGSQGEQEEDPETGV